MHNSSIIVIKSVKRDWKLVRRSDLAKFMNTIETEYSMALTTELKIALSSLIDQLLSNPKQMRNMAADLKPLTRDDIEVAFGIFVGYVTGGFAELFFESQKRSMTSSELIEVRKIIFDRALEMKKAIAHVRAIEKNN